MMMASCGKSLKEEYIDLVKDCTEAIKSGNEEYIAEKNTKLVEFTDEHAKELRESKLEQDEEVIKAVAEMQKATFEKFTQD